MEKIGMKCNRFCLLLFCSITILFILICVSLCIDFSFISPIEMLKCISSKNYEFEKIKKILIFIRIPRTLLALGCGAALGFAGALMQCVLANELAFPYTLGISSAASFGVALTYVLNFSFLEGAFAIKGNAFLFSMLSLFLLYFVLLKFKSNKTVIVLTGIAINFLFSSLTSVLKYFASPEKNYQFEFWALGSLSKANFPDFFLIFTITIISFFIVFPFCNDVGMILNNEKDAQMLGVPVKFIRVLLLTISSILTSFVVATIGIIGFIGLVSPHLCRLLRISHPKKLAPLSMVFGAIILTFADFVSRMILKPQILPVGAITSLIGIPFFVILIFRARHYE